MPLTPEAGAVERAHEDGRASLDLSLRDEGGVPVVSLFDRSLEEGLVVRELELELEVDGGAFSIAADAPEMLRDRRARLRNLVFELELARVADALSSGLAELESPIRSVALIPANGMIQLEAKRSYLAHTSTIVVELGLAILGPCELGLFLGEILELSASPWSAAGLLPQLESVLRHVLGRFGDRVAETLRRAGPCSLAIDPVHALVLGLLARRGWKIPAYQGARLERVSLGEDGLLRLEVRGLGPCSELLTVGESPVDALRARENAARGAVRDDALVALPDPRTAYATLTDGLTSGSELVLERSFSLGTSFPELAPELRRRSVEHLAHEPSSVVAALALARVAELEADEQTRRGALERAARSLKDAGRRRAAGLAFLAASRVASEDDRERARLLEEAIALIPDDVEALEGLVEVLPRLERASAAVRAARRLATVAEDHEACTRAHVVAGDLLHRALRDPAQARREYERALKLVPDDVAALEGLARSMLDQGQAREALSLFAPRVEACEREGRTAQAARLSRVLGEMCESIDPVASVAAFRRAAELDPLDLSALLRIFRLARATQDAGLEARAVDEGLLRLSRSPDIGTREERRELYLAGGLRLASMPGRDTEALDHLERALEIEPRHVEALSKVVELHRGSENPSRLEGAIARLSRILLDEGAFARAAPLLRERMRTSPEDVRVLSSVRQDLTNALARAKNEPAHVDPLLELSDLEPDARTLVEALERRLLLDDPPLVRAGLLLRLGRALERLGRISEAARVYDEAVARDPARSPALEALVRIHRAQGDAERLVDALERIEAFTSKGEARTQIAVERAQLLASLSRDAEGLVVLKRVFEDSPADPQALALATQLALRTLDFAAARAFGTRRLEGLAETAFDARVDAHLELAMAAEGLEDRAAMISELAAALGLAGPDTSRGREIARRLAVQLELAGLQRELAALDRALAAYAESRFERAHRLLEAGRRAARLASPEAAEAANADLREVLALFDEAVAEVDGGTQAPSLPRTWMDLERAAVEALEPVLRMQGDPRALAELLSRRVRHAASPEEREVLRIEHAQKLEEAGLRDLAQKTIENALADAPQSMKLLEAFGELALRNQQLSVAASSFGRLARIAVAQGFDALALDMFSRAAELAATLGDMPVSLEYDRALLPISPLGRATPPVERALARLERHARDKGDFSLLVELLGKKASMVAPNVASELLLEKSSLERDPLGDARAAIESLRRARALAAIDGDTRTSIEDQLVETLARAGAHEEQAVLLLERAEAEPSPERQSALYLECARVAAGPLGDRGLALLRLQSALRAFPANRPARELRLSLLREGGRRESLVDALEDEAALLGSQRSASPLLLEAAETLAPSPSHHAEDPGERPDRYALERARELVLRAMALDPDAPEPLRLEARCACLLGRVEEEFVALERLIDRDIPGEERVAAYLRRADLLRGPLSDLRGTFVELDTALVLGGELLPAQQTKVGELLPSRTALFFELKKQPLLRGILRAYVELANEVGDHSREVELLLRLVDESDEPRTRAELRTRAGEVLEWKLGDGAAAEREYRVAIATDPTFSRAREVLRSFYVATDRFGALAENMGVDALREVWKRIQRVETPARVAAAGGALWPLLPESSEERAEVQLQLADIYTATKGDPAQIVHLLELVTRSEKQEHQREALERLAVLFLEQGRHDLYVDVLRRRCDLTADDRARARLRAELGDALEWKIGDGASAEREYRAALAIDPRCEQAVRRLAVLLAAQDRFRELGEELGAQALVEELERLTNPARRDRERAWKAMEALVSVVEPERRGTEWMRFADRFAGEPEELSALQRAVLEGGADELQALDRLIAIFESTKDEPAIANVLRRRVSLERDPRRTIELRFRLGAVLLDLMHAADATSRPTLSAEAESELSFVVQADPAHVQARHALESLCIAEGRIEGAGRVLGKAWLEALAERAERDGERALLDRCIEALAALSQGEARATFLLQLVGRLPESPAIAARYTSEGLYRSALDADPLRHEAREGLRAIYLMAGRYADLGDVLGRDALKASLSELSKYDGHPHLLPALLAYAKQIAHESGTELEQKEIWLRIAALHAHDQNLVAVEDALRRAFAIDALDEGVRERLRRVLVAQDRIAELLALDERLVSRTAEVACEAGDRGTELKALRLLIERRSGEARADLFTRISSLELANGCADEAELALRRALEASPEHAQARFDLEGLLWGQQRFGDFIALLGPHRLMSRAHASMEREPELAKRALALIIEDSRCDAGIKAEANELSAHLEPDHDTRLALLRRASAFRDALDDRAARARVHLAIAAVHRERGDVDALIDALGEALRHATAGRVAAEIALERAKLMVDSERFDAARALLVSLLDAEEIPAAERLAAARSLVDDVPVAASGGQTSELHQDRARALELLVEATEGEEKARHLDALASAREALGIESEQITAPLEAALACVKERAALPIWRRLRAIHEERGNWAEAERYAARIADLENRSEEWVSLSELRVWLDDRAGAGEALMRALATDPGSSAAHGALVALREREGDEHSLIESLASWAENDIAGSKLDRARRMLRAARIARRAPDDERSSRLAERAVELARDPEIVEQVALEALELVDPSQDHALVARILSSAMGAGASSSRLRIRLVDALLGLGRKDEANTVLEQGLKRSTAEDDPLLQRVLDDVAPLSDDAAARRLLGLADRLGSGPAARRIRIAGAERAERAGDTAVAASAWCGVASEAGAKDDARRAREAQLRLAREAKEPRALVEALLQVAEEHSGASERAAHLREAAIITDQSLGDTERAETLLRRAVARTPEDERLVQELLDMLEAHGHYAALDHELKTRAISRQGEAQAQLLERRARLARDHFHDLSRAALLFTEAHAIVPSVDRAVAIGRVLRLQGRIREAEETLARAKRMGFSGTPRAYIDCALLEAELSELNGAPERAISAAMHARALAPDSERVEARLIALLSRLQRYRELASVLDELAARAEPALGLRARLAAARLLTDEIDEPRTAREVLLSALSSAHQLGSDPEETTSNVEGWFESGEPKRRASDSPIGELATRARALGAHDLAIDALRLRAQALPVGPMQWRALLALASAERAAGDLEAAELTLTGVVEAERSHLEVSPLERGEAQEALGLLLLERELPARAAESLLSAIDLYRQLGPEGVVAEVRALVGLAAVRQREGNASLALAALLEAHALDPSAISENTLEAALEAGGSPQQLAEMVEHRAERASTRAMAAEHHRRAAELWSTIDPARELGARVAAFLALPLRDEARALTEKLREAERHLDLEAVERCRQGLLDLTDNERIESTVSWARTLHRRLARGAEALEGLARARELLPRSRDLLVTAVEIAAELGSDARAARADALAALIALEPGSEEKRKRLSERAMVLEALGEPQQAMVCLEQALDLALEARRTKSDEALVLPLSLIERLESAYARDGNSAQVARLWARVAEVCSGAEAAAALSRVGHVRLVHLGDRRGTIAAYEAALRHSPDDLALRRLLIVRLVELGDDPRAREHVRAAIEGARALGGTDLVFPFMLEEARLAGRLSDRSGAYAAWSWLLKARPEDPRLLDHFLCSGRSSLEPEHVVALLDACIASLPAGLVRARYRRGLADVLESAFARRDEAEIEREAARREEAAFDATRGDARRSLPPLGRDADRESSEIPDGYRALRAQLDREGRFEALARLEEKRAEALHDPRARANTLVEAGRMYLEAHAKSAGETQAGASLLDAAKVSLERALEAFGDHLEALELLLRVEVERDDFSRTAEIFARLERLGGPAWPAPQFELLGARIARADKNKALELARLLRARERDPHALEVLEALAELAMDDGDPHGTTWLREYEAALDPVTGAERMSALHHACGARAFAEGRINEASVWVNRALEVEPKHEPSRKLLVEILSSRPNARALADQLVHRALALEPPHRFELLEQALRVARETEGLPAAREVARRFESYLPKAHPLSWTVLELMIAGGDDEDVRRQVERVGGAIPFESLPRAGRLRLARVCLRAGRSRDVLDILVSFLPRGTSNDLRDAPRPAPSDELLPFAAAVASVLGVRDVEPGAKAIREVGSPRVVARVDALLDAVGSDAEVRAPAIALLEGLATLLPKLRHIQVRLAALMLEDESRVEVAARMMRVLVEEQPVDRALVSNLLRSLLAAGATTEAIGPSAVARFLGVEAPSRDHLRSVPKLEPLARRLDRELLTRCLHHPSVETAMGRLLAQSAMALARVLPSASPRERVPGLSDLRVAPIIVDISRLLAMSLEVAIDPEGGHRVRLEPGSPPTILLGEALVSDASVVELRFHIARASMLIQLGYLVAEENAPVRRRAVLELLIDACLPAGEPGSSNEPSSGVERIRGALGLDGMAACAPFAKALRGRELELGGWISGAVTTANRFGLLVTGDLEASLRALLFVDPRAIGERFDSVEDRERALGRSAAAVDLIAFAMSDAFATLLRSATSDTLEASHTPSPLLS